jgi:CubicO group peptidase (beta-lactamase class C family)
VLDLDAPAPVPEWRAPTRSAITLLDLLEMRPGLRFVEDYVDDGDLALHRDAVRRRRRRPRRVRRRLPLDHQPGTVWNYSSGTTNIICRILGDVVGAGRAGMRALPRDRLFGPPG